MEWEKCYQHPPRPWSTRMDKQTILVDTTWKGESPYPTGDQEPPRTLNDFITRKFESLEDICIPSEIENLRLISGAGEILSLANPKFAQKVDKSYRIFSDSTPMISYLILGPGRLLMPWNFLLPTKRLLCYRHSRHPFRTPTPLFAMQFTEG